MQPTIGIEVGSSAVRLAVLAGRGEEAAVRAYAESALPPGAVTEGGVTDVAAVQLAVEACARQAGLLRRGPRARPKARLGVSGLRAIVRELDAPAVPDSELDQVVRLQALDVVPFPLETMLLSARRLAPGEHEGGEGGAGRALLAAVHRELVGPLVAAVSAAGLEPVAVEPSPLALVRALGSPEEGAEAVVSIGAELTTVAVHERGEVHFVRTVAGGGGAATRSIAAALDLPLEDAEELKRRIGGDGSGSEVPQDAVAAAQSAYEPVLTEIRSSISYYGSLPGRSAVRRVVLTGGGALLPGLAAELAARAGFPVALGELSGQVKVAPATGARPALAMLGATAVGLALPEARKVKALDLLPPEVLAERRVRQGERGVLAGAALVVAVVGVVAAGRVLEVHRAEGTAGSLGGSISVLQHELPGYAQVEREDATILSDARIGAPLVGGETNWPAVLQDLRTYTPAAVQAADFAGTAGGGSSGQVGAAGSTAAATTTAASAGSAQRRSSSPPAGGTASPPTSIGSVQLTFSAPDYPSFQRWFDAMQASQRFEIVSYSGVTSSGPKVTFSADLALTNRIRSSRSGEFTVPKP